MTLRRSVVRLKYISNAFAMRDQKWQLNVIYIRLYGLGADSDLGKPIQAVAAAHPMQFDERIVRKLDLKDCQPHCPNPTN